MTELKKYQWATTVLAVVAITMALLLAQAKNAPLASNIQDAKANLASCNAHINAWKAANPKGATTVEAQTSLSAILDLCASSVK